MWSYKNIQETKKDVLLNENAQSLDQEPIITTGGDIEVVFDDVLSAFGDVTVIVLDDENSFPRVGAIVVVLDDEVYEVDKEDFL